MRVRSSEFFQFGCDVDLTEIDGERAHSGARICFDVFNAIEFGQSRPHGTGTAASRHARHFQRKLLNAFTTDRNVACWFWGRFGAGRFGSCSRATEHPEKA